MNVSAIKGLPALWVMFGNSINIVLAFRWVQFDRISQYHKTGSVNPQPDYTRLFLANTK